jgi:hypothetical protein
MKASRSLWDCPRSKKKRFPVLVSLTLVLCLPQVFTDAGQYAISFGSVGNSWSFIDPEDVSVPMR